MAPLAGDRTMHALVSAMRDEVASGAGTGRLYGESLSLAVMSYVVDRIPPSRLRLRGRCSEAQLGRLTKYIRERLGEDLTLSELAGFVQLGPRQLSESFRDAFGVTPYRYVLDQRLDEGARRLASSLVGIAELALSLGFSSQSHFAAAFRKRFGETPRQYAKSRRGRTLF
jgi:AraC family transcriptional regulator